jgi:DNA-binding NtrC family response regulator
MTLLGRETLEIGRGAECAVQLDGSQVSRVHASIRRTGPIHSLRDEGSRNGTWRNGVRVVHSVLEPGDVLQIGGWTAVVVTIDTTPGASFKMFDEPVPGLLIGPRSRGPFRQLSRAAASTLPVILSGPTGTGKELFARALHDLSGRSGSFVAVNCGALPETLIEAQLFGHARGAYTGALRASVGFFAAADRGTLFLDEVLDLPVSQQGKLLRAIEENSVTALGETEPRSVDVRVVVATHHPLEEEVKGGRFRADLFARLSGLTLNLTPLCQRREEIPRLFLRFFAEHGGNPSKLRPAFIAGLCLHAWPFNVRELRQAARRAVLTLEDATELGARHLDEILQRKINERNSEAPSLPSAQPPAPPAKELDLSLLGARSAAWLRRSTPELNALLAALQRCQGNISAAARETGISLARAHRLVRAARVARGDA